MLQPIALPNIKTNDFDIYLSISLFEMFACKFHQNKGAFNYTNQNCGVFILGGN